MKSRLTYIIQAAGVAIAAAGIVYNFDRILAGTFVFGGLAFFVGWFLRKKNLL
jgi:hypothetical protein